MSQDEFTNGLQFGFEAADRPKELAQKWLVDWRDDYEKIYIRPSRGKPVNRRWATPRERELILKDLNWLVAEGFISYVEAREICEEVWSKIASRIEYTDEIDPDEPFADWLFNEGLMVADSFPAQGVDFAMLALGVCASICFAVCIWLAFDMWGWK